MQAGQLRHRLTIEQPTLSAPNEYGDRVKTWSTYATVWASIEAVSGREAEYARTFAPTVTHKIKVRYLAGLLPTMRGTYGGNLYTFDSVLDLDGRRRELSIYATQILNPVTPVAVGYNLMTEAQYNGLVEVQYNVMGE